MESQDRCAATTSRCRPSRTTLRERLRGAVREGVPARAGAGRRAARASIRDLWSTLVATGAADHGACPKTRGGDGGGMVDLVAGGRAARPAGGAGAARRGRRGVAAPGRASTRRPDARRGARSGARWPRSRCTAIAAGARQLVPCRRGRRRRRRAGGRRARRVHGDDRPVAGSPTSPCAPLAWRTLSGSGARAPCSPTAPTRAALFDAAVLRVEGAHGGGADRRGAGRARSRDRRTPRSARRSACRSARSRRSPTRSSTSPIGVEGSRQPDAAGGVVLRPRGRRSATAPDAHGLPARRATWRTAPRASGIHVQGGFGFTLESDLQLYFRRAKGWTVVERRRRTTTCGALGDVRYGAPV